MKLIVGLGNPGIEYEDTRHNAGFKTIDLLSTRLGAELKLNKNLHSLVAKTKYRNQDVVLVKPLTYMNESGRAVVATLHWFKIRLDEALVLHDDVSLPLGKVRMQRGGGAGGQHGIESIIDCLGGRKSFDRIKIGVGPDPGGDLRARFVLSRVPEAERELYSNSIIMTGDAVQSWIDKGAEVTANFFNGRNLGAPEQKEKKKAPKQQQGNSKANQTNQAKVTNQASKANKASQTSQVGEANEIENDSKSQSAAET